MTDPIPTQETEIFIVPDHQAGAFANCDCTDCVEKRLGPDSDHTLYTPHDMTDAWKTGWTDGFASGLSWAARRVGDEQAESLSTAESLP